MDRIFATLYSDRGAYQSVEAVLPVLKTNNPREIKRYINLFRFYMFIRYQQRRPGEAPQSGDEIAKLAALAIRWPQLLTTFTSASGGNNPLHKLESVARNKLGYGEVDDVLSEPDKWIEALTEIGFAETAPWCDDLRRFLSMGPEIGDVAQQLL
jgi:hypothetical protein